MYFLTGIYRVVISALLLSLFGLGGIFLSSLVFLILFFIIRDKKTLTEASRKATALSFRFYLRLGCLLKIFKIRINGIEKIKNDRSVIYIANHPSLLDVVIFLSRVPNPSCLMKSSIRKNPFMKGISSCNKYIDNSENPLQILKVSQEQLDYGDNIIIFPEGTRTLDENKLKFTHGFSSIALTKNYKIRPVTIKFKGMALTKTGPWYKMFYAPVDYDITFLDYFDTEDFVLQFPDKEKTALSRILSKKMENLIQLKLKEQ